MQVMGAISIKNVMSTTSGQNKDCFKVHDDEKDSWELCTFEGESQKWICAISKVLGQPCEEAPKIIEKRVIIKQPVIIIPLPSPDCRKDWNYNAHGKNWVCKCQVGLDQSPIDLPNPSCLKLIRLNANFEYNTVKKESIDIVYEINMIRMKTKDDDSSFGTLTDIDGSVYEAYEI
jgi:hypothetical protein